MPRAYLWQGNIACAEGAIAAGCRFFAGYPITPANEISEHMAKRMPEVGGIFIQMEDEMASLAAVIGASWAGLKAMTATSGPGFSLMQELIGYAFFTETPCVIVDVMRVGPSTGQATRAAQGDLMQARWGTHGDYCAVALAPNSPQEMFELTVRAFDISERLRTPVVVLSDEIVAHMRENVLMPDEVQVSERPRPEPGRQEFFGPELVPPMPRLGDGFKVPVTGSTHDERGIRFTRDPLVHRRLIKRLVGKITSAADELADWELVGDGEGPVNVAFISFGSVSRSVEEAVAILRSEGLKACGLRLRTVWPLPEGAIGQLASRAKAVVVPELNMGQLVHEVRRIVAGRVEVHGLSRVGGGELPTPEELADFAMGVVRG